MAAAALTRSRAAGATQDFLDAGYHVFEPALDASAAARLLAKIRAARAFDASLFLSEAAFDADPQHVGVNPRPGRNLLERHDADLAFVEKDPGVVAVLTEHLGAGYE